jgi:hypothetical protein
MMRFRKDFWIWLESVVELDKGSYANCEDYGFSEDCPF